MATEFAAFNLKPGVDIDDESSDANRILLQCLDTVMSQPGAQRCYYSGEHENRSRAHLYVDWDKIEDHVAFTKSEVYGPMMKLLGPLLEPEGTYIKHVHASPFPPTALQAPTTEVLTAFFPASLSAEQKDGVSKKFQDFFTSALEKSPAMRGIQSGWSVENDVPVTGKAGQTGNVFIAFIGWDSVQAHLDYRDAPAFKENIGAVRDMPDLVHMNAFHVHCRTLDKKI